MFDTTLITSEVCIRCGACCSAYVRKGTTELVLLSEVTSEDEVEVVACRHLRSENGRHVCGNYEQRPTVCRQYSCLERANQNGLVMPETNALAGRVRNAVREVHGREIEINLCGT